jgi:hypothetical protein|tara:strand:+ start:665 stop:808 length:144 start_codon:yes stop_codon:yes gene_type:complete
MRVVFVLGATTTGAGAGLGGAAEEGTGAGARAFSARRGPMVARGSLG